jgi:chromosome segregation ATPase
MAEEKKGRSRQAKDALQKIQERIYELADRVKEEALELSKVSRTKLDIMTLKRERNSLLADLGARAYGLLKRGKLRSTELNSHKAKVDKVEEKISALEAEVRKISRTEGAAKKVSPASPRKPTRAKARTSKAKKPSSTVAGKGTGAETK